MRHHHFLALCLVVLSATSMVACGNNDTNNANNANNAQDATPDVVDDATPDADTSEDTRPDTDETPEPCAENERVEDNACVACPAGTTHAAGDDPSGDDTMCLATRCEENERVQGNQCVACAPGTVNDLGDDASGDDTTCVPVLCAEDERVRDNQCVACDAGDTNVAGDDSSGEDTVCDDVCFRALGVTCEQFEQAYVKASSPDAFDRFGSSVALSGNTMVVGATDERSIATGVNGDATDNTFGSSGAAYVFVRDGVTWSQQAYLKASTSDMGDRFGTSVAIDGDTIVVGSMHERSNATGVGGDQTNNDLRNAGAAYVFTRTGTTWSQQAYLKASNTGIQDAFGATVAVHGDTVAVGAYREDSGRTGVNSQDPDDNATGNSGAVYVFVRAGEQWSQQAYIKASNPGIGDEFGFALDLEQDVLVVGAPKESSSATGVDGDESIDSSINAGAVYVFTRQGTDWSQQSYIKASNTGASDRFGASVALSGDTLAVGAPGEASAATGVGGDESDDSVSGSGAAYVFLRQADTWVQQAYLKPGVSTTEAIFGQTVALSGELLAVGSPHDNSQSLGVDGNQSDMSAPQSGAVHLFERQGTNWGSRAYIKSSNTDTIDFFGFALAIDGNTMVVGAPKEASRASGINGDQTSNVDADTGAVYVRQVAP